MKKQIIIICLGILFTLFSINNKLYAQQNNDSIMVHSGKTYIVTKQDGNEYVGKITYKDPEKIIVNTSDLGQISIPMSTIKSIRPLKKNDIDADGYITPGDKFLNRYFLSTSAAPPEKHKSYMGIGLFGIEYQTALASNLSIRLMTTWIGLPIVGSLKYHIPLSPNNWLAIGGSIGTGGFYFPHSGGLSGFIQYSFVNEKVSFSLSGRMLDLYSNEGGNIALPILEPSVCWVIDSKISIVAEGYFQVGNNTDYPAYILLPGIRFQTRENRCFQIAFGGIMVDNTIQPFPYIQWHKILK